MAAGTGPLVAAALVVVCVSFLLQLIIRRRRRRDEEFPPGPPAWPIIGHLPLLMKAAPPYQVLAELSAKHGYGPILGLRLGSQPAVVVSSPALARDLLLTHDKTFANRPPYQFSDTLFYGHDTAVILSSYSPHWVRFRKFYTLELFTAKRIQQLQHIRHDEVRNLLCTLLKASQGGTQAVDVGRLLGHMTSNATTRLLQSKTLAEGAPELSELIRELEDKSIPTLGDFLPALKCLDVFQKRGMKHLHDRIDKVIESIIQERRLLMASNIPPQELHHDFLQVILSKEASHEDEVITPREIKGIILDILGAGIQTSSTTLEWAIAELIRSPRCLQKLHTEIDAILGEKMDLINDEDVAKLPYLQNTVKEVLRLHPGVPLLVPRISSTSCKVNKYTLPKGTQAFVNVWAIGRDPHVWEKPNLFSPERFEGKDMDTKGKHYELLPFGSGRRVCAGMRLALITLQVTLANLVSFFDWDLPHGQNPSSIDMSEKAGLGNRKALPMLAIPKARLPSHLIIISNGSQV